MDNTVFSSYKIEDRSYLSFIKREIHNLAMQAGYSHQRAGEVDIIISELATNLIKHANTGEFVYRLIQENDNKAIELFCIDNGPGTDNISRMMKDGASSANTLGQGLGALTRLSDIFQIYSKKDWGTIAYTKKYMNALPDKFVPVKSPILIKTIQSCIPGEQVCGDGYAVKETGTETQIFLGDGLGHGKHAHEAVQAAIQAFKACQEISPIAILRHIHQHVKKTRGLVGAVAILNHASRQWRIGGIGNIATRLYVGLTSKNYMSYNGIIGLNIPTTMNDTLIDEKNQSIIMCSDGIKTRWDLSQYPSLLRHDPAIIAAALYKDYARHTDDMTILVGKINM